MLSPVETTLWLIEVGGLLRGPPGGGGPEAGGPGGGGVEVDWREDGVGVLPGGGGV